MEAELRGPISKKEFTSELPRGHLPPVSYALCRVF